MLRWLLCGIAIVGTALEAHAADLGDSFLRGSNTVIAAPGGTRWDGFYIGGHVGMSVPGIDFTNNTQDLRAVMAGTGVTSTTVTTPLGNQDSTSKHFGGFVGYQQQWDGAVIGVEGTYNWVDKALTATNSMSGGFAAAEPISIRLRARRRRGLSTTGHCACAAAGRPACSCRTRRSASRSGGWTSTARVVVTPTGAAALPPVSQDLVNQFGYGYAAGLGVDFCLMANLFMRAEYEYVHFPDFLGLNAHMHNVRIGAALKF